MWVTFGKWVMRRQKKWMVTRNGYGDQRWPGC